MKRINSIIVLSLALVCFSCKKDFMDVNMGRIKVTEQESQFVKDNDTIFAELLATCEYSGTIRNIAVQVGFTEDLVDAFLVSATKTKDGYVAAIPVRNDTVYYYRYVVHRYSTEFDQTTEWVDDTIYQLLTDDLRLPSVTTNAVKFVSTNYALGCGTVTEDDGLAVIERGFCWGTQLRPTIRDYYSSNGNGMGDFYMEMKNLESGKNYYARAYARNNQGVVYGRPFGFKTQSARSFSVETLDPTEVEECSANFKGELVITASASLKFSFGFLFGLTPNTVFVETTGESPNISTTGSISIPFNRVVSTLENNTKYYVRAFAVVINNHDTIFGEKKSFFTQASPFEPVVELNGAFSVSPTLQVQFSPGNLQYHAYNNRWRFARQQWEYIGENNKNLSATYYGWIDLFGWGTSGNNHGATCYQPWSSSYINGDYYAYGSEESNLFDQSGLADWGSNTIYLGSNATAGWRTLTSNEWDYLMNSRVTPSGMRYAKAQLNVVNGTVNTSVNGIVVFPDDWDDNGLIYQANVPEASYTSNIIFVSDWKENYEAKGVAFLPAAGRRSGSWYYEDDQKCGCYWSASKYDSRISHPYFYEDGFGVNYLSSRYFGYSVRLVRDNN